MGLKFLPRAALLFALIASAAFALTRTADSVNRIPEVRASAASSDRDTASGARLQLSPVESPMHSRTATVVTWKGSQDQRWSNPGNWEGGHVPGATEVARFAARSSSAVLVDAASSGRVAGLVLDSDYRGTLSLDRDLTATNLVLAGGTFEQGNFRLSVRHYRQTGGAFLGAGASLLIQDGAIVSGGTLHTSKSMTAASLTIESPGVVMMAANSKLDLTGDGEPLTGNGLLDVTTNGPNSLEYTGHATADVLAATPIRGALPFAGPSRSQATSERGFELQQSSAPTSSNAFGRVGALTLTAEEDYPFCAVIDTAKGFAYFGTLTSPGIVVKVRLSDFTRIGAVVMNAGENDLRSGVIDTVNGFAYFGSLSGHVVKIRLSDFTRVAAFDVGGPLAAAVIDTANGFAYFGAYTGPGAIVKVRLSDFTPVDVLILNAGEDGILSAVIDTVNGFAYFGTGTDPHSRVVKVRLSDFSHAGALILAVNEIELTCAVIDTANGFAYFGSFGNFAIVVKVRLSDFTRVGAITLAPGETFLRSAVIDSANGFAYFGTGNLPGKVVKVRLSDFTRVGALTLNLPAEGDLLSAVIDPGNGFAYFAFNDGRGVARVRLSDFTRDAVLALSKGEDLLDAAVIDEANGFAYFAVDLNPGTVVKVRLSDFTRVGILILNEEEIFLRSAAIDTVNGFAYFGTDRAPGKVVKVRLSDFTRVGAITLNPGENYLYSAAIDTVNGFAYFGTVTNPGLAIKVRLSDFTRVGALNTGENQLRSAVIDIANGFVYFGTGSSIVVKVRLSDFTRVGALSLNPGEDNLFSAVIDTGNGFAYFGSLRSPGKVYKVRLSDLSLVDALTLNAGEDNLASAVIDTANGFVYFGTGTKPGKVVKVQIADVVVIPQLLLEESGPVLNQVAALDSVLFLRDPIPVFNDANLLNLGSDRNTRAIVFVANLQLLQGEPSSAVIVDLVDSNNQSYNVPAEDVRQVPNFNFVQVIFRLPDGLAVGPCGITIKAHGQVSNGGTIRIRI